MSGLVVRSPDWAVLTLLQWRPITVLLIGNAVPIGLTSVHNTGDRVAVKGRQDKLTQLLSIIWFETCLKTTCSVGV